MPRLALLLFETVLTVLSVQTASLGQEQPTIQPSQLVGKKINVQRLPLCEPGTYKVDLTHAGMEATVLSAKPSTMPALSKSVLDKIPPAMRDMILDQQKAALLLLRFDDGAERDTCAAISPTKLAEYVELSPGQTLEPVAVPGLSANLPTSKLAVQSVGELSDEEVRAALEGKGRDHWVRIDDAGLMAAQGAQVPSITLLMPDAVLAMQNEFAKKQFVKFEPTQEDRERALMVLGQGFVAEHVQGGCISITRIVLLSDPSGKVVKEAYLSKPSGEIWQNAFGATNYCQSLTAKFSLEDVQEVRDAAQGGEFYIAVFSGAVNTKMYKIKQKHQSKLGLK